MYKSGIVFFIHLIPIAESPVTALKMFSFGH